MSKVTIDLTDKNALITGGTRGIGAAIANLFHDAGANVICTGTCSEQVNLLNRNNTDARKSYLAVNFSDETSVSVFLDELKLYDRIDILINNAGVNRIQENTETNDEDYNLIMEVNVKGPYRLARDVSKKMKRHGYGRIVNITSIWSAITRPGRSLYTTSKFAIVGLTKSLAVELAKDNILVNSVGPGFTSTELTIGTNTQEELEKIASVIPVKRMAKPIEIANLVLFLASDLNSYVTGQNIIIDGGYTVV
jgi:3-oxoacyl-[acyl-carrier protein] reductase